MLLVRRFIMPPREWMHDPNIENAHGNSLKYFFECKNFPIPYHWHDNDMTIFD